MSRRLIPLLLSCCVLTLTASADTTRPALSIGVFDKHESIPLDSDTANPPLDLIPEYEFRALALPFASPLPTTPAQLPDIVSVCAGYHSNDIAELVRNNCLEPLDPILQSLSVDIHDLLPSNVLQAVTYEGKIWALPHRLHTLVLRANQTILLKLQFQPAQFASMETTLAAAARIATEGKSNGAVGFVSDLDFDTEMAILLHYAQTADLRALIRLAGDLAAENVFGSSDSTDDAIRIMSTASLIQEPRTVFFPFPKALVNGASAQEMPSFLECYAVKKNSPEKLAAARTFIQWLIDPATQLALVKASLPDKPWYTCSLKYRHFPIYRTAQAHPDMGELIKQYPVYQILKEQLETATFAPADAQPGEAVIKMHQLLQRLNTTTPEAAMAQFANLLGGTPKQPAPAAPPASGANANKPFAEY